MGAYRKRGGKKGKSFLLGIGRRAFQPQPEAPFTPAAALRGVLQAGRSPQKASEEMESSTTVTSRQKGASAQKRRSSASRFWYSAGSVILGLQKTA